MTATKKIDCVFFSHCGNAAGPDGEHLLLSALGGLRESKKILCKPCNERFGATIDNVLAIQLGSIGGAIGVRTAREKRLLTALAKDETTGEEFRIDADRRLHYAGAQTISESMSGSGRISRMRFSSEAQMQRVLADLRKKFSQITVSDVTRTKRFHSRPVTISASFGGIDGLRGVGKLALNHLAHHFPTVARQKGLEKFKSFILGNATNEEFVWFDFRDYIGTAVDKFSPFAHRIVLSIDKSTGLACAHLSLYSIYGVAVLFGPVDVAETKTVVVDINPLATKAGAGVDVRESILDNLASVRFGETRDSADVIETQTQANLVRLFEVQNKISWESYFRTNFSRLVEAKSLGGLERRDAIREIIQDETQPILCQIVASVPQIRDSLLKVGDPGVRLLRMLDAIVGLIESGNVEDTGLSVFADCIIFMVRGTFAQQIESEINDSTLTMESMRLLFEGGRGRAIALAHLLRLVERTMPEYSFLGRIVEDILQKARSKQGENLE